MTHHPAISSPPFYEAGRPLALNIKCSPPFPYLDVNYIPGVVCQVKVFEGDNDDDDGDGDAFECEMGGRSH